MRLPDGSWTWWNWIVRAALGRRGRARPGSTPAPAGFALARSDAQPYNRLLLRGDSIIAARESFRVAALSVRTKARDVAALGREIDDRRAADDARRAGVERRADMLGRGDAEAENRRRRAGSLEPVDQAAIELAAGVGAGDPGAADAISVGLGEAWRCARSVGVRACWRRRSAPARSRPAPSPRAKGSASSAGTSAISRLSAPASAASRMKPARATTRLA